MNLNNIEGIKIFLIESLPNKDRWAVQNIKDDLRQFICDRKDDIFEYEYLSASDVNEFEQHFSYILKSVEENDRVPIIQIECHGSTDGIQLASYDNISWSGLFNLLRPINIASQNLLFLNLSMCNADAIIRFINPTKRAPFRAITGPEGKVYPEPLIEAWHTYYSQYESISIREFGLHKLAQKSGLIYYNQDFIFDAHYDLANKDPELFNKIRDIELNDMCKPGERWFMNPEIYKKWVADKQKKIKDQYRSFFCFDELKPLYESIYNQIAG